MDEFGLAVSMSTLLLNSTRAKVTKAPPTCDTPIVIVIEIVCYQMTIPLSTSTHVAPGLLLMVKCRSLGDRAFYVFYTFKGKCYCL